MYLLKTKQTIVQKKLNGGTNSFSNETVLDNWIFTCRGMKLDSYLTSHIKTNSEKIINLNIKANTIKLLEET